MQQMLWDGFSLVSFTGTPFFAHLNLTLDWYVQSSASSRHQMGKILFFFFSFFNYWVDILKKEKKRSEPVTVVGGVTKKLSTKLSTVIITTDQKPQLCCPNGEVTNGLLKEGNCHYGRNTRSENQMSHERKIVSYNHSTYRWFDFFPNLLRIIELIFSSLMQNPHKVF